MTQRFQDGETVIITRGSKTNTKGTEATVLGYDGNADKYTIRTQAGDIVTLKESALGPKPERTFTVTELTEGLTDLGLDGPAIVHDLCHK